MNKMKNILKKFINVFFVGIFVICCFSNYTFADTIEIRNGVKTTYADRPTPVIDTVDKGYTYKWALDKKGNWKLYLRRLNGKQFLLSNTWVNLERTVLTANNEEFKVVDYYYFDYYGAVVTGWFIDINHNKYYLNANENELGRMARGWTKIGDDYYYFSDRGILQFDTITPDGFYVDPEGKWK